MSILSQIAISQAAALAKSTLGRRDLFIDLLDGKVKIYNELNVLVSDIINITASGVPYTLTVPSDWDGSPSQVQSALDELASRVKSIEGKTDLITITGAVDLDDVKSKADSALQPGDNVSELVNDAGYITASSLKPSFNVDLDSGEATVTRVFAGGRTTFTVTHSLNTLDIKPEVFRLSDGQTIGWRIRRTGVNTVEARRNGNIADGDYRMVI